MGNVRRGVVFDLDGLMIDSERFSFLVWRRMLAGFGKDLTPAQYDETVGMDIEWCAARVIQLTGLTLEPPELANQHMLALTEMVRTSVQPQPGLIDLVTEIKKRGLRTGIASNSSCDYIDAALAAIGMQGSFDCIISSQDVTRAKPAPDVYLAAAACLGLVPCECLALEDSRVGLFAAHAAGMACVLVPSPGQALDSIDFAYARFDSLADIGRDVLEGLLRVSSNLC